MHGRHDQLHAAVAGDYGVGHNREKRETTQWQTPHAPNHDKASTQISDEEQDLDLVEQAFIQGFTDATDPTSFLRLAGVAFEATKSDGTIVRLLRVELRQTTDIGSITPHLGGETFRYDPLPAKMISQRKLLEFVYFSGHETMRLTLKEARSLRKSDSQ